MTAQPDSRVGQSFASVFAVGEFRALWTAQLLSVVGDQFARVALTLLVYDRTRSALLAAITFAASVVPLFIGGIFLAGLADRLPRRRVLIACDLARLVLVLAMIVPGVPIGVLVALLFVLTMLSPPFTSARAAIYADVLPDDRLATGQAVTVTTTQLAQVAGFAVGGAVVALAGVRPTLLADAVTFGCSALISWIWVRARPAPGRSAGERGTSGGSHLSGVLIGVRLSFTIPGLRSPMLLGFLAAFYNAPEGVAAPLARSLGHASAIGYVLAAGALGAGAGAVLFGRLAGPATRLRLMRPLSVLACLTLAAFALRPPLPLALLILFVSGLFDCYQVAASTAFIQTAPPEHRSQVLGIAQAGMSLLQGAVMILAGLAAGSHAPTTVIAASGLIGTLIALAIPTGHAMRDRSPA
ncbi:MAG TPA: MFS transporter [Streptosporangiaceae bacterium]